MAVEVTALTQEHVEAPERLRGFSAAAVQAISEQRAEPDWLQATRASAWAAYEAIPMPTRRDEGWRRTDVSRLPLAEIDPAPAIPTPAKNATDLRNELRSLHGGEDHAAWVLVEDGGLRFTESDAALACGSRAMDTTTAIRAHPDLLRRVLYHLVPADSGKFDALNAAAWTTGTFVHVPSGAAVERPIVSTVSLTASGTGETFRNAVLVEDGASATIVDERVSGVLGGAAIGNGVVEVAVGAGAHLTYVVVQSWGPEVTHFERLRIVAQRDATVNLIWVTLGGAVMKASYEVVLDGPGANAKLMGIVLGDGSQHVDLSTLQLHRSQHTSSDLLHKTALRGRARSIFSGMIWIDHEARDADAYQLNRNLLLSPKAKAESIPTLEILNSEVRCTHGASVSPVDQDAVFYLMTRGLSQAEAERLVVEGFFEPVVRAIPQATLQSRIWQQISGKLEQ